MEVIITLTLFETFLIKGLADIERKQRLRILKKWETGSISMEEIQWLKKQPWFQNSFTKVATSFEKKNE